MCVGCSLEEARSRYSETEGLYELNGVQGQIVFRVDWVNDAVRWRQLTLGNRLSVRAADHVFHELTAPEHLRRQMELNAVLRDERTLDIGSVTLISLRMISSCSVRTMTRSPARLAPMTTRLASRQCWSLPASSLANVSHVVCTWWRL